MQNVNIKNLTLDNTKFFRAWLEVLRPFHKMANKEMEMVTFLLQRRHYLKSKISDDKIVDKLLLDAEIREELRAKMDYSTTQVLNNKLSDLRSKKILIGNKISPLLIPNLEPESDNFKLVFNFNIKPIGQGTG